MLNDNDELSVILRDLDFINTPSLYMYEVGHDWRCGIEGMTTCLHHSITKWKIRTLNERR